MTISSSLPSRDDRIEYLTSQLDEFMRENKRLVKANASLSDDLEAALRRVQNELEQRVQERTQELGQANERLAGIIAGLRLEIGEHERSEQAVRESQERLRTVITGEPVELQAAARDGEQAGLETQSLLVEEQIRQHLARNEALSELSGILAEVGRDYTRVLETVARRVTELLGDNCTITLISEDRQRLEVAAFYHPDPDARAVLETIMTSSPYKIGEGLAGKVAQTGTPLLISNVPPEQIHARVKAEYRDYMARFGAYSILVVPMRAHSRIIGTLGVTRSRPERPYTPDDQSFLVRLAGRAALAIVNALLFQALENELAERQRIEAELAEVRRGLIDSREYERLKISQELHDGPVQTLYGIVYQMKNLQDEVSDEPINSKLAFAQDTLLDVIRMLRVIYGELRPPTLAPFGLEKTILSHAEQFQHTYPHIRLHLELAEDGQRLPEHVRLALFRIYKSLLSNAGRHSQAKNVTVRLILDNGSVHLEVQDDGEGFSVPERWIEYVRQGQLGLAGAAERAEAIGGKLAVESQPGRGTTVRVVAPIPHSELPTG